MSDPLSIASGVAGLVALGITVTQTLVDFYASCKGRDKNVERTLRRLSSLLESLDHLKDALHAPPHELRGDAIGSIESQIWACEDVISELEEECQKVQKTEREGFKDAVKQISRRAAYPFRESTLKKLEECVQVVQEGIGFALDVLNVKTQNHITLELRQQRSLLESIRASQISSELQSWLDAPDATSNYNEALSKRHQETGTWFTQGEQFGDWLRQRNSFLWLNGFAGCGKSVLCAGAIEAVCNMNTFKSQTAVAFFFFSFNDASKQDAGALLRCLLYQLSSQLNDGPTDLTDLRAKCKAGKPSVVELRNCLMDVIDKFDNVFIFLDALDESPRGSVRESVLETIDVLRREASAVNLHLLVTGRDEVDIHDYLQPAPEEQIAMKNESINQDISDFIDARLRSDRILARKWGKFQDEIRKALAERSQGVFRWVECQFEALRRCPSSPHELRRCLTSLPPTLNKTYDQMIAKIEPDKLPLAKRLFTLLCCTPKPLTVEELIEAIAVDLAAPAHLNIDARLQDAEGLKEICPGMVEILSHSSQEASADQANEGVGGKTGSGWMSWPPRTVQLAHYSVKEYLIDKHAPGSSTTKFTISMSEANLELAQICLTYLLEHQVHKAVSASATKAVLDFPLIDFAAVEWPFFLRQSGDVGKLQFDQLSRIFDPGSRQALRTWLTIGDIEAVVDTFVHPHITRRGISHPIYYASLLGLTKVVDNLLASIRAAEQKLDDVMFGTPWFGTPLQAAAFGGHTGTVLLLLAEGLNVNATGGSLGNALQAASLQGHVHTARALLEHGADVNAQGGRYGNALQAASARGSDSVVRLLIDKGADVNRPGPGGLWGGALQSALFGGHEKVMEILVESGAELDVQPGDFYDLFSTANSGLGTADIVIDVSDIELPTATKVKNGKVNIRLFRDGSEILLENPDTPERTRDQQLRIIALLIKSCSDTVLANWGLRRCMRYREEFRLDTVERLIELGGNLLSTDEFGRTALHAPLGPRAMDYVMTRPEWRNVITSMQRDKQGLTVLHHIARSGTSESCAAAADLMGSVDPLDFQDWTPLHWAAYTGEVPNVRILLEKGADTERRTKDGQSPVELASRSGHFDVEGILINARPGAEAPNTDNKGRDILHAGAYCDACGVETTETFFHCTECFSPPGYDLCFRCVHDSHEIHPGHVFIDDWEYSYEERPA